jgi:hypothetical protein
MIIFLLVALFILKGIGPSLISFLSLKLRLIKVPLFQQLGLCSQIACVDNGITARGIYRGVTTVFNPVMSDLSILVGTVVQIVGKPVGNDRVIVVPSELEFAGHAAFRSST